MNLDHLLKAFKIIIKEFKSFGSIKIKDINIQYFEVDHKPVKMLSVLILL